MQFDACAKKAERLLRGNWTSMQVEAHRLAGLGLPNLSVSVGDTEINLILRALWGTEHVVIYPSGEILDNCGYGRLEPGHHSGVARLLANALEDVTQRAAQLEIAREEMAKIK